MGEQVRQVSVPPELENILLEYTVNVLVEKPDDIISHAADYFARLRENRETRNPESSARVDGETTDIRSDLGMRSARRLSVVGETYNPEEDDDDDEQVIEVHPKTDEQRKKIKEIVKNIFLFRCLDEDDLQKIIDAMIPREVLQDQVIIQQGDDGDFFYVIDNGKFDCFVDDDQGNEKHLLTYEDAGSFGELALLYNQPRAATIKAKTDGFLWAVSRKTFQKLVMKRAFQKQQLYKELLESVPELQPLKEYEKMKVCDALTPVALKEGAILFEEGDKGDGMYFVESGKVGLKQKKTGEVEVAVFKKGDYFGEMALVKHQPRAGTVVALEDSKLAFLDLKAFERLLGPCLDIMKRRMEKYES